MPTDTQDYSLSTAQPPDFLGHFTLGAFQASTPFTVTPGAGTVGLVIAGPGAAGAVQVNSVLGVTTGNQYWSSVGDLPLTVSALELFVPVAWDPARDPSLNVLLQNLAAPATGVDIFGVYQAMPLLGRRIKALSQSVTLAHDQYLYDAQGFAHPAAGSQASVTAAAPSSGRWIVDAWAASMQSGGTAGVLSALLVDGPLGGANLLDGAQIGVSATAGNIDRIPERRGHYSNQAGGTALTVQFSAALAGASQQISLGAYLG